MTLRLPRAISRVVCLALLSLFALSAVSQTAGTSEIEKPVSSAASQAAAKARPVPVEHLYRNFLIYLSFLDQKADERAAQGEDSRWIRNALQNELHFTDAEFAPMRESARRLGSELSALEGQAKAIKSAGALEANREQLRALSRQRRTAIDREEGTLKQSLSLDKRAQFEAFLMQFFSPKPVTYRAPSSTPKESRLGKAGAR